MPFRALIVKADRLCAETLKRAVERLVPEACIRLAHRLADANAALSAEPFDLLICGIELPDGDMLDLLAACLNRSRRVPYVLVVTGRHEPQVLKSLHLLPIDGLLDSSTEGLAELDLALRSVVAGTCYWSKSVQASLHACLTPTAISQLLTPTEQIIFSVLGGGCDDDVAAAKLCLKAGTINSARRAIHRKLKIQHRGDLVRIAVESGFVRLLAAGTFRPAFAMMLSACSSRKIPHSSCEVTMEAPSASCVML